MLFFSIFSLKIVGFLAAIVVLIVILAVGPLFRTLPNSCLAAIIVTAMKNMLLQTKQLPILWRINKLEFLAWIITFWGVVLLDVDYGLYIGVIAMIFLLIVRSQRYKNKINLLYLRFILYFQDHMQHHLVI
jgi:MFS superfamily sulfate permease-like transporter